MELFKRNKRSIIILCIAIILSLIFFNQIIKLLLAIGQFIYSESISFQLGYWLGVGMFIFFYTQLIIKKFIHNNQITFLIFYVGIIYILLRVAFPEAISFLPRETGLKFSDIIFLIVGLHIFNLSVEYFTFKEIKKRKRIKSYFIEDSLYAGEELDNEKILKKLIEVLQDNKPEVAFNVGINAVWGYGKSSFLLKFEKEYSSKNPNAIIFWNRIWKNKGSTAIIENFFEELKENLKPYSAEISQNVDKYVDSVLSLSSSDLNKIISSGREAFNENATLEKFFNGINGNIKKIDRQIIILLDDLDRLERPEIMNTLKLIRTLSDFNNVIFIAGYDRQYVVDTMESPKDNYLDKIFNVEINLLPFDERLIVDELLRQVDVAFPPETLKKDSAGFNEGFRTLFIDKPFKIEDIKEGDELIHNNIEPINFRCTEHKLKYQDFLKTYRDVKRFMNEFKFNASFLENEDDVIAEEYILLKLLTYKYRNLQNTIFNRVRYIFERGTLDSVNNKIQTFAGASFNDIFIYNEDVKNLIFTELRSENYSDQDFEIINAVLCKLFSLKPLIFYRRQQNSISKIYFTDIYIRNNIAGGQISISQLQKAFERNNLYGISKRISKDIKQPNFQLSNELKQFIFNNAPQNKTQFLDELRTLNFILPHSNLTDDQKVIDVLRDAFHNFYDKNKKTFIDDLLRIINNEPYGFLIKLFREINLDLKRAESKSNYEGLKKYRNIEFLTEDLKMLLIGHLKHLIKTSSNPETIHQAYMMHVEAIVGDKKILFSKEGNELIKSDIENRVVEYIKSPVFETLTEKIDDNTGSFVGYSPHFAFAHIFSNPVILKDLIQNPNNEAFYKRLYEEGWVNFNSYIKSLEFSEADKSEIGEERIKNMKEFLQAFIDNDQKPLSKTQYDKIWNDLPF